MGTGVGNTSKQGNDGLPTFQLVLAHGGIYRERKLMLLKLSPKPSNPCMVVSQNRGTPI